MNKELKSRKREIKGLGEKLSGMMRCQERTRGHIHSRCGGLRFCHKQILPHCSRREKEKYRYRDPYRTGV